MDLTLWEMPAAANDWSRIVLRVNGGLLTACMIEWKR
jgi:hypothetical protein